MTDAEIIEKAIFRFHGLTPKPEPLTVGLYLMPDEFDFTELREDGQAYAYICSDCAGDWVARGAIWIGDTLDYACDLCGCKPDGYSW